MKRCILFIMVFVLSLSLLTGCGGEQKSGVTETTIEVKKNGAVVHTIVESFTEGYYGLDTLMDTMQTECDAYNEQAGSEVIKVESAEVEPVKIAETSETAETKEAEADVLTVVMSYKDAAAYAGFNQEAMFAGTVKDAYHAGYDLDVTLEPAYDGGEKIGKPELLNMGEKHIVIVRELLNVKVFGKILGYSSNVEKTEDSRTLKVTDKNKLAYIVFD